MARRHGIRRRCLSPENALSSGRAGAARLARSARLDADGSQMRTILIRK